MESGAEQAASCSNNEPQHQAHEQLGQELDDSSLTSSQHLSQTEEHQQQQQQHNIISRQEKEPKRPSEKNTGSSASPTKHPRRGSCQQTTAKQNSKQLTPAQREYWQRKLPRGFDYYLGRITSAVITNQPENVLEFCSQFVDELVTERANDLTKLPEKSYFLQLRDKKFGSSDQKPLSGSTIRELWNMKEKDLTPIHSGCPGPETSNNDDHNKNLGSNKDNTTGDRGGNEINRERCSSGRSSNNSKTANGNSSEHNSKGATSCSSDSSSNVSNETWYTAPQTPGEYAAEETAVLQQSPGLGRRCVNLDQKSGDVARKLSCDDSLGTLGSARLSNESVSLRTLETAADECHHVIQDGGEGSCDVQCGPASDSAGKLCGRKRSSVGEFFSAAETLTAPEWENPESLGNLSESLGVGGKCEIKSDGIEIGPNFKPESTDDDNKSGGNRDKAGPVCAESGRKDGDAVCVARDAVKEGAVGETHPYDVQGEGSNFQVSLGMIDGVPFQIPVLIDVAASLQAAIGDLTTETRAPELGTKPEISDTASEISKAKSEKDEVGYGVSKTKPRNSDTALEKSEIKPQHHGVTAEKATESQSPQAEDETAKKAPPGDTHGPVDQSKETPGQTEVVKTMSSHFVNVRARIEHFTQSAQNKDGAGTWKQQHSLASQEKDTQSAQKKEGTSAWRQQPVQVSNHFAQPAQKEESASSFGSKNYLVADGLEKGGTLPTISRTSRSMLNDMLKNRAQTSGQNFKPPNESTERKKDFVKERRDLIEGKNGFAQKSKDFRADKIGSVKQMSFLVCKNSSPTKVPKDFLEHRKYFVTQRIIAGEQETAQFEQLISDDSQKINVTDLQKSNNDLKTGITESQEGSSQSQVQNACQGSNKFKRVYQGQTKNLGQGQIDKTGQGSGQSKTLDQGHGQISGPYKSKIPGPSQSHSSGQGQSLGRKSDQPHSSQQALTSDLQTGKVAATTSSGATTSREGSDDGSNVLGTYGSQTRVARAALLRWRSKAVAVGEVKGQDFHANNNRNLGGERSGVDICEYGREKQCSGEAGFERLKLCRGRTEELKRVLKLESSVVHRVEGSGEKKNCIPQRVDKNDAAKTEEVGRNSGGKVAACVVKVDQKSCSLGGSLEPKSVSDISNEHALGPKGTVVIQASQEKNDSNKLLKQEQRSSGSNKGLRDEGADEGEEAEEYCSKNSAEVSETECQKSGGAGEESETKAGDAKKCITNHHQDGHSHVTHSSRSRKESLDERETMASSSQNESLGAQMPQRLSDLSKSRLVLMESEESVRTDEHFEAPGKVSPVHDEGRSDIMVDGRDGYEKSSNAVFYETGQGKNNSPECDSVEQDSETLVGCVFDKISQRKDEAGTGHDTYAEQKHPEMCLVRKQVGNVSGAIEKDCKMENLEVSEVVDACNAENAEISSEKGLGNEEPTHNAAENAEPPQKSSFPGKEGDVGTITKVVGDKVIQENEQSLLTPAENCSLQAGDIENAKLRESDLDDSRIRGNNLINNDLSCCDDSEELSPFSDEDQTSAGAETREFECCSQQGEEGIVGLEEALSLARELVEQAEKVVADVETVITTCKDERNSGSSGSMTVVARSKIDIEKERLSRSKEAVRLQDADNDRSEISVVAKQIEKREGSHGNNLHGSGNAKQDGRGRILEANHSGLQATNQDDSMVSWPGLFEVSKSALEEIASAVLEIAGVSEEFEGVEVTQQDLKQKKVSAACFKIATNDVIFRVKPALENCSEIDAVGVSSLEGSTTNTCCGAGVCSRVVVSGISGGEVAVVGDASVCQGEAVAAVTLRGKSGNYGNNVRRHLGLQRIQGETALEQTEIPVPAVKLTDTAGTNKDQVDTSDDGVSSSNNSRNNSFGRNAVDSGKTTTSISKASANSNNGTSCNRVDVAKGTAVATRPRGNTNGNNIKSCYIACLARKKYSTTNNNNNRGNGKKNNSVSQGFTQPSIYLLLNHCLNTNSSQKVKRQTNTNTNNNNDAVENASDNHSARNTGSTLTEVQAPDRSQIRTGATVTPADVGARIILDGPLWRGREGRPGLDHSTVVSEALHCSNEALKLKNPNPVAPQSGNGRKQHPAPVRWRSTSGGMLGISGNSRKWFVSSLDNDKEAGPPVSGNASTISSTALPESASSQRRGAQDLAFTGDISAASATTKRSSEAAETADKTMAVTVEQIVTSRFPKPFFKTPGQVGDLTSLVKGKFKAAMQPVVTLECSLTRWCPTKLIPERQNQENNNSATSEQKSPPNPRWVSARKLNYPTSRLEENVRYDARQLGSSPPPRFLGKTSRRKTSPSPAKASSDSFSVSEAVNTTEPPHSNRGDPGVNLEPTAANETRYAVLDNNETLTQQFTARNIPHGDFEPRALEIKPASEKKELEPSSIPEDSELRNSDAKSSNSKEMCKPEFVKTSYGLSPKSLGKALGLTRISENVARKPNYTSRKQDRSLSAGSKSNLVDVSSTASRLPCVSPPRAAYNSAHGGEGPTPTRGLNCVSPGRDKSPDKTAGSWSKQTQDVESTIFVKRGAGKRNYPSERDRLIDDTHVTSGEQAILSMDGSTPRGDEKLDGGVCGSHELPEPERLWLKEWTELQEDQRMADITGTSTKKDFVGLEKGQGSNGADTGGKPVFVDQPLVGDFSQVGIDRLETVAPTERDERGSVVLGMEKIGGGDNVKKGENGQINSEQQRQSEISTEGVAMTNTSRNYEAGAEETRAANFQTYKELSMKHGDHGIKTNTFGTGEVKTLKDKNYEAKIGESSTKEVETGRVRVNRGSGDIVKPNTAESQRIETVGSWRSGGYEIRKLSPRLENVNNESAGFREIPKEVNYEGNKFSVWPKNEVSAQLSQANQRAGDIPNLLSKANHGCTSCDTDPQRQENPRFTALAAVEEAVATDKSRDGNSNNQPCMAVVESGRAEKSLGGASAQFQGGHDDDCILIGDVAVEKKEITDNTGESKRESNGISRGEIVGVLKKKAIEISKTGSVGLSEKPGCRKGNKSTSPLILKSTNLENGESSLTVPAKARSPTRGSSQDSLSHTSRSSQSTSGSSSATSESSQSTSRSLSSCSAYSMAASASSQLTSRHFDLTSSSSNSTSGSSDSTSGHSQLTSGSSESTSGSSSSSSSSSSSHSQSALSSSNATSSFSKLTYGPNQLASGPSQLHTCSSNVTFGSSLLTSGRTQSTAGQPDLASGESLPGSGHCQLTSSLSPSHSQRTGSHLTSGSHQLTSGQLHVTSGSARSTHGSPTRNSGPSSSRSVSRQSPDAARATMAVARSPDRSRTGKCVSPRSAWRATGISTDEKGSGEERRWPLMTSPTKAVKKAPPPAVTRALETPPTPKEEGVPWRGVILRGLQSLQDKGITAEPPKTLPPDVVSPRLSYFPLRLYEVPKEAREDASEVTRMLTLEEPQKNVFVNTTFERPNPRKVNTDEDFEVSSEKQRLYLSERPADFAEPILADKKRRLICEPEAFAGKNNASRLLVVENGTSRAEAPAANRITPWGLAWPGLMMGLGGATSKKENVTIEKDQEPVPSDRTRNFRKESRESKSSDGNNSFLEENRESSPSDRIRRFIKETRQSKPSTGNNGFLEEKRASDPSDPSNPPDGTRKLRVYTVGENTRGGEPLSSPPPSVVEAEGIVYTQGSGDMPTSPALTTRDRSLEFRPSSPFSKLTESKSDEKKSLRPACLESEPMPSSGREPFAPEPESGKSDSLIGSTLLDMIPPWFTRPDVRRVGTRIVIGDEDRTDKKPKSREQKRKSCSPGNRRGPSSRSRTKGGRRSKSRSRDRNNCAAGLQQGRLGFPKFWLSESVDTGVREISKVGWGGNATELEGAEWSENLPFAERRTVSGFRRARRNCVRRKFRVYRTGTRLCVSPGANQACHESGAEICKVYHKPGAEISMACHRSEAEISTAGPRRKACDTNAPCEVVAHDTVGFYLHSNSNNNSSHGCAKAPCGLRCNTVMPSRSSVASTTSRAGGAGGSPACGGVSGTAGVCCGKSLSKVKEELDEEKPTEPESRKDEGGFGYGDDVEVEFVDEDEDSSSGGECIVCACPEECDDGRKVWTCHMINSDSGDEDACQVGRSSPSNSQMFLVCQCLPKEKDKFQRKNSEDNSPGKGVQTGASLTKTRRSNASVDVSARPSKTGESSGTRKGVQTGPSLTKTRRSSTSSVGSLKRPSQIPVDRRSTRMLAKSYGMDGRYYDNESSLAMKRDYDGGIPGGHGQQDIQVAENYTVTSWDRSMALLAPEDVAKLRKSFEEAIPPQPPHEDRPQDEQRGRRHSAESSDSQPQEKRHDVSLSSQAVNDAGSGGTGSRSESRKSSRSESRTKLRKRVASFDDAAGQGRQETPLDGYADEFSEKPIAEDEVDDVFDDMRGTVPKRSPYSTHGMGFGSQARLPSQPSTSGTNGLSQLPRSRQASILDVFDKSQYHVVDVRDMDSGLIRSMSVRAESITVTEHDDTFVNENDLRSRVPDNKPRREVYRRFKSLARTPSDLIEPQFLQDLEDDPDQQVAKIRVHKPYAKTRSRVNLESSTEVQTDKESKKPVLY